MIDIYELIEKAKADGYSEENAQSKVCQDIVLSLIAKSSLSRNVTIKGGVVMRSISHDARRATQDIDLDFIKYSLQDDSIIAFINKLNALNVVSITTTGRIEELKQQDYHGKRIHITITDENGYTLSNKMDLVYIRISMSSRRNTALTLVLTMKELACLSTPKSRCLLKNCAQF